MTKLPIWCLCFSSVCLYVRISAVGSPAQYGHSLSQSVAFDSLLAFILVKLIVVICTCLSLARARTDSVSDQSLEWIQSLDRVNHGPEWTVQADCVVISYRDAASVRHLHQRQAVPIVYTDTGRPYTWNEAGTLRDRHTHTRERQREHKQNGTRQYRATTDYSAR